MDKLRDRTISFSDDSASTGGSVASRNRSVRFNSRIQVALLPWQEKDEARRARSGDWMPAPLSDELWDGDYMVFRDVELTPDEFKKLLKSLKPAKKSALPIPRAFARMFSAAVENEDNKKTKRLSGVDIIHARARVFAEDFDEEERDSNGRLASTEFSESSHIVMKLSAEEINEDEVVYRFEEAFVSRTASPPPPPPPPRAIEKRPSEEMRMTRFIASPPSSPSPTQIRMGLVGPAVNAPPLIRKKSSGVPAANPQRQVFECGEGKRPLFYYGFVELQEEDEDDRDYSDRKPRIPSLPPKRRLSRKRSILGAVMSALFPVVQGT